MHSFAERCVKPDITVPAHDESSTYKKVAVASTFSPRFEQVLSEAGRIRERFGADLSLIYIGERNDETAKKFQEIFGRLQLPGDSPVHYGQGDAADGILRAIADNDVDLIVAGALEKQSALHPFLGNVARRLLREASCSVLLFTNPELKPKPLRRIVSSRTIPTSPTRISTNA